MMKKSGSLTAVFMFNLFCHLEILPILVLAPFRLGPFPAGAGMRWIEGDCGSNGDFTAGAFGRKPTASGTSQSGQDLNR